MRCEDAPCCGHGREGCADRPEATKDYWLDLMMRMEAQGLDDDEIDDMMQDYADRMEGY